MMPGIGNNEYFSCYDQLYKKLLCACVCVCVGGGGGGGGGGAKVSSTTAPYSVESYSILTSAQLSAEVRALQRGLCFYILGLCLQFVVYASLVLDRLPFHASKDFNSC